LGLLHEAIAVFGAVSTRKQGHRLNHLNMQSRADCGCRCGPEHERQQPPAIEAAHWFLLTKWPTSADEEYAIVNNGCISDSPYFRYGDCAARREWVGRQPPKGAQPNRRGRRLLEAAEPVVKNVDGLQLAIQPAAKRKPFMAALQVAIRNLEAVR
jgi:hypothetical protein